jgi:hypothetical protein
MNTSIPPQPPQAGIISHISFPKLRYCSFRAVLNRMGCVYLVGSKAYGMYKIGYSKNDDPTKRTRSVAQGVPFHIEILKFWVVENPKTLEKALHNYFRNRKVKGEWFRLKRADLDRVDCSTAKILKNIIFYEKWLASKAAERVPS